jgi:hypothetical protein
MVQHPDVEAVDYADNIYLVSSLTRAHNAFHALAASMAKNMSLAVSTSQSYIYLPWHDETDWQIKRKTYDALKILREAQGKTTLPLVKDGFTCLGTHIGSADSPADVFPKDGAPDPGSAPAHAAAHRQQTTYPHAHPQRHTCRRSLGRRGGSTRDRVTPA